MFSHITAGVGGQESWTEPPSAKGNTSNNLCTPQIEQINFLIHCIGEGN